MESKRSRPDPRRHVMPTVEKTGGSCGNNIINSEAFRRCAGENTNMPKCDYCGTTIFFGGAREGNLRFCNNQCRNAGVLLAFSQQIPESLIHQKVWEVHRGICPKCGGLGPVDVHTSYRVWSALFLTSWSSRPQMSCRSCGIKSQLGNAAFSLALGWWGFPWGFLVTPVQVGRNLIGAARGPDPSQPSAQLEKFVRISIAAQVAATAPPDKRNA